MGNLTVSKQSLLNWKCHPQPTLFFKGLFEQKVSWFVLLSLVIFFPFLLSIVLNIQGELYSSRSIEHSSNVRCSYWRVNYAFVEKEEQTKKEKT